LLQTGQISGPYECAIASTRLLGAVVSNFNEKQPVVRLIERIREVGAQLIQARPSELTVGNMVRRVLGLIKECSQDQAAEEPAKFDIAAYLADATAKLQQGTQTTSSKHGVSVDSIPTAPVAKSAAIPADKLVKDILFDVVGGIDEILDELDSTSELTSAYSPTYIFPTDVVLIHGHSALSHRFLAQAAKKDSGFVVFAIDDSNGQSLPDTVSLSLVGNTTIEENDPTQDGDDEAEKPVPLAKLNVSVTIIPPSAVFSIMAQVTKVLISPDAVFPDGSVISTPGTSTIVLAAKAFGVPVLSLSGTYHFHPLSTASLSTVAEVGNTGYAVGLEEACGDAEEESLPRHCADGVYYSTELVGSDGIDLYITNV
jgi:translation initiation factor eIF-2B subunit beta